MKVMETVSALWIFVRLIIFLFFRQKTIFLRVMMFVLRVPVVFEYLHDWHTKKNAPLQRLAMWVAKVSAFDQE